MVPLYRKLYMLMSDHYARVMLAEISSLHPGYYPNESPKLKTQHFNTFVLLLKATKIKAVYLKLIQVVYVSNLVYVYLLLY